MKYHIEINICPIIKNDEGEKVIDTVNPVGSLLTQGNGLKAGEWAKRIEHFVSEMGVDHVKTFELK